MRRINKILLIHSAHHANNGKVVKAIRWIDRLTVTNVAEMALPLLAAYTPSHIQIDLIEDYLEEIPWDSDADVVGISAQVMTHSRAIELADAFRTRGKIVIMGGFLPSMHPDRVVDHVDALCIGEGDKVWQKILQDIECGTLQKIYRGSPQDDVSAIPTPRYDLIKRQHRTSMPVQATRGCPFTCSYCSIIQVYPGYRLRPVADVIRDIRASGSKDIHFTDDNLTENRRYARELFTAMRQLNVRWGAQVTINIARDSKLLRLAYAAGCRMLAVGVESLSQQNLDHMSKQFTKVPDFTRAFKSIQDSGIGVHALIVFGMPDDTVTTFDDTVTYLEERGVAIAEFFIYTPYPGTPEGARLLQEQAIIDHDLSHYRECYVTFKHPRMSAEEILSGYWRALRRFYSIRSIIKRLWLGTFRDKWLHLAINLYYWIKVRRQIVPVYFGRGNF